MKNSNVALLLFLLLTPFAILADDDAGPCVVSTSGACVNSTQNGEPQPGRRQQQIAVQSDAVWDNTFIEVCWENPTDGNADGRRWTLLAIQDTWEANSRIRFVGWGACPPYQQDMFNRPLGKEVRIEIADDGPHVDVLGQRLAGRKNGMTLNFDFEKEFKSCKNQRQFCIEVIAVHEFGHALGLAHEHNREDTPDTCTKEPQGTDPDVYITPYDDYSVMNYCNPRWSGNGELSEYDIAGIQALYGAPEGLKPRAKAHVHLSNGGSLLASIRPTIFHGYSQNQRWLSGDFDGDDRDDLIAVYGKKDANGRLEARALTLSASRTGFTNRSSFSVLQGYSAAQQWMVGDVNGDGKTDLINLYGKNEGNRKRARAMLHLSTGNGFEKQSSFSVLRNYSERQRWFVGDVNGDGKDDLVNLYGQPQAAGGVKARAMIHLSNGAKFAENSGFSELKAYSPAQRWLIGDVNGDGRDDLVNVYGKKVGSGQRGRAMVHLSTGRGFEAQSSFSELQAFNSAQRWMIGDVTGDGKADLINVYGKNEADGGKTARAMVHPSSGAKYDIKNSFSKLEEYSTAQLWMVADQNGDGWADLINFHKMTLPPPRTVSAVSD